jgi:hypothetical protein
MRRVLAGGGDAIMAGAATTKHLGMINGHYGYKRIRRVAVFTDVCCPNVGWALAGSICAVMAGTTTANYLGVIDCCHRCKYDRAMAVLANICRLHVCRVFADCIRAVVTTDAVSSDIRMVEKRR